MSITTFGRKITGFEHNNAIKHDPQKINNEWNSLCVRIDEGSKYHYLTFFATRPKFNYQTDWREEIKNLTLLLNELKRSSIPHPEITVFQLGSRVVYKDPLMPPVARLNGKATREIGFDNLQSIDKLFFDQGLVIKGDFVTARTKEILEVHDMGTGDVTAMREIYYEVNLNIEGADHGNIAPLIR